MDDKIYKIATNRMSTFHNSLEKLSRRMIKLAGHPVTYTVVGEEIEENKDTFEVFRYTLVKINGGDSPAVIDGWKFVAAMDRVGMPDGTSETLIRTTDTRVEVMERCLATRGACEHCGTNRKRNRWYLLERIHSNAGK